MIDWRAFFTRWSRELMRSELAERIVPPPDLPDWLGFDPATNEELQALEQRLGLALPPSYREFLLLSNGWRRTSPFIERVRPAQEVDWFNVENEEWASIYAEYGSRRKNPSYYDYESDGAADYLAKHMTSLVQISDVDDGVYLLNPKAVTPDGEWEAWFFANWIPGARRFPSFAHLMLDEYRSFASGAGVSVADVPVLPTFAADVPRKSAMRRKVATTSQATLEELIERMQVVDDQERDKALRAFQGRLKGRPRAERRPDLVPVLTELFHTTPHAAVRSACVAGLTEMADDDDSPSPLLAALTDSDPAVVLSGIFALTYFPDRRAIGPLCEFVDSRANVLFNESAMSQLGEFGDERAVPTLNRVLLDIGNSHDQSFGSAAIALAHCGAAGFEALAAAHHHDDARIRLAAVVGLDVSGDPRAIPLLKRSTSDPDPNVRNRADCAVRMSMLKRSTS